MTTHQTNLRTMQRAAVWSSTSRLLRGVAPGKGGAAAVLIVMLALPLVAVLDAALRRLLVWLFTSPRLPYTLAFVGAFAVCVAGTMAFA